MATWSPIANTVPQYAKDAAGTSASGYYIKLYAMGTTTPISMASDSTGAGLLAKAQLNSEGYPLNGSNAIFIPYADQNYNIVLYLNATDADNNTFASAVWNVGVVLAAVSANISSNVEKQLGSSAVANVFTLTSVTYVPAANNLLVFQNGQKLIIGDDYTETSNTKVTLTFAPNSGDSFEFVTNIATALSTIDTSAVTHTQNGNLLNLATHLNNVTGKNVVYLSEYATWDAAIAFISTTETVLVVGASKPITANTTLPENISLKWLSNSIVTGAFTLTIKGSLEAGLYQIFDAAITLAGFPGYVELLPEWFGVMGSSADQLGINAALLTSTGSAVKLKRGSYSVNNEISITQAHSNGLVGSSMFKTEIIPTIALPRMITEPIGAVNYNYGQIESMHFLDSSDLVSTVMFFRDTGSKKSSWKFRSLYFERGTPHPADGSEGFRSLANMSRSLFEMVRFENYEFPFTYSNVAGGNLQLHLVEINGCDNGLIFAKAGGHYIKNFHGDSIKQKAISFEDGCHQCVVASATVEQNGISTGPLIFISDSSENIWLDDMVLPTPLSGDTIHIAENGAGGSHNNHVKAALRTGSTVRIDAGCNNNTIEIKIEYRKDLTVIDNGIGNNIIIKVTSGVPATTPILSSVGQGPQTSILPNGDFSSWAGANQPTGWQVSTHATQETVLAERIHSATNNMLLTTPDSVTDASIEYWLDDIYPLDFLKGKSFIVTCLTKPTTLTPASFSQIRPTNGCTTDTQINATLAAGVTDRLAMVIHVPAAATHASFALEVDKDAGGSVKALFYGCAIFLGTDASDHFIAGV